MTRFEIVSLNAAGDFIRQTFETADAQRAFAERGFVSQVEVGSKRHLRAELQDKPCFVGLVGPALGGERDGVPIIRYETPAAFRALSA